MNGRDGMPDFRVSLHPTRAMTQREQTLSEYAQHKDWCPVALGSCWNRNGAQTACQRCGEPLEAHSKDYTPACPCSCGLDAILTEPPAPQQEETPRLDWGEDDGDYVVRLRGMPHWHLSGVGRTRAAALISLGEAMWLCRDSPSPAPDGCTWTQNVGGYWRSGCAGGSNLVGQLDTPSQLGVKFCPYCGKSLTEVASPAQEPTT